MRWHQRSRDPNTGGRDDARRCELGLPRIEAMETRILLAGFAPTLAWNNRLGGSDYDFGQAIAVDFAGNVIVAGSTWSSGWISGGFDTSYNGSWDGFVTKLDSQGRTLWSTYLGATQGDMATGVGVDRTGNIFVTGQTDSSGWVSGGFDTSFNGGTDAFVVKLSPTGQHLWSTFIGGTAGDAALGIAVDALGNAVVCGYTASSAWTSGGFDTSFNGGDIDAFVVKLNASGQQMWSAYIGSGGADDASDVAVDATGNIAVAGNTDSAGWISGGFDTTYNGGVTDGFVIKLNTKGQPLWSSYLGGTQEDRANGVAFDPAGRLIVVGQTASSDWVSGGFDSSHNGANDVFVVQCSATGGLLWSTYLGGSGNERAFGLATDLGGNLFVTGQTFSGGWAMGGFNAVYGGAGDVFVVKLTAAGLQRWSSYIGGADGDFGSGIAIDSAGNIAVVGDTEAVGGGFNDVLIAQVRQARLPGDSNHDDAVDFNDLVALAQNYDGVGRTWEQGDFTGDGRVDFQDLVTLAQNYDTVAAAPAAPVKNVPLAVPAVRTLSGIKSGGSNAKLLKRIVKPASLLRPIRRTSTALARMTLGQHVSTP